MGRTEWMASEVNPVAIPGTKYGNYLQQHHNIKVCAYGLRINGGYRADLYDISTTGTVQSMKTANGHKRSSGQDGGKKSEWHYIIQWLSNTLFRLRRIRQNKQDLAIWNKDKAYTQFNKGRCEAEAIQTNFT